MDSEVCHEHSGCVTDIENLKNNNTKLWLEVGKMGDRIDAIMTRLNVVLGGVVVACLMLLLNLILVVV